MTVSTEIIRDLERRNRELLDRIEHDGLTGLLNRDGFEAQGQGEPEQVAMDTTEGQAEMILGRIRDAYAADCPDCGTRLVLHKCCPLAGTEV